MNKYLKHETFLEASKKVKDNIIRWQNREWIDNYEIGGYIPWIPKERNASREIAILTVNIIKDGKIDFIKVYPLGVMEMLEIVSSQGFNIQLTLDVGKDVIIDIVGKNIKHARIIADSLIDVLWETIKIIYS